MYVAKHSGAIPFPKKSDKSYSDKLQIAPRSEAAKIDFFLFTFLSGVCIRKIFFVILNPNMLWVLKRTVSMRQFF